MTHSDAREPDLPDDVTAAFEIGVMTSNAFPKTRETPGATLRAIGDLLARFPGFRVVQTVDIVFADERRAVRERVHDAGLAHTYVLTRVLQEENLSALDPAARVRAVQAVLRALEGAGEAGANVVGLVSGPAPADAALRPRALDALEASLREIGRAAGERGLTVEIEPLDVAAHKRGALGRTAEAVAICERLVKEGLPLALCLDSAHLWLNDEAVPAAIEAARPHLLDFHFCNAITDRAHPLFGDHHLPFSVPGRMTVDAIADGLRALLPRRETSGPRPRVSCEVRTPSGQDPLALIAECNRMLQAGWERARARAGG
jgi:sugar phosphate isomerase/epimerase